MSSDPTADRVLAAQILLLVGFPQAGAAGASIPTDVFRRATRKQLIECAPPLGLTGVSKLTKDELAERIEAAFARLRPPAKDAPVNNAAVKDAAKLDAKAEAEADAGAATSGFSHKFELGPDASAETLPHNIPWGYGQNRVTAMVVDPDRLYVYWEVTDDALAAARAGLGDGGAGAWLSLRVYDITGRLFDGTNAHSYFDHQLDRNDRQWFFVIGKPTSAACVEIGLKSSEGFFVKIARSGRVDFPRRAPAGDGPTEWLSVRTASGPVAGAVPAAADAPHASNGVATAAAPAAAAAVEAPPAGWEDWTHVVGFPVPAGQRLFGRRWEWQEADGTQWATELSKTEWVGPLQRTEWESGPFTYAIEAPSLIEQREHGEVAVRTEHGRVYIVYGPWQVVIRGIGARSERRVLGTWEYRRQVSFPAGGERTGSWTGRVAIGASETLLVGGSERLWLGASELVFRGASELWMLGASELLLRGASEQSFIGASEYRARGASELLLRGASERRLAGASESLYAGASERRVGGASELTVGGGSERVAEAAIGASSSPYPAPEGR